MIGRAVTTRQNAPPIASPEEEGTNCVLNRRLSASAWSASHEPGRRNPFHGDHNDEERRDLRIGQHVLTVIACEGDIEAEVTYLPDDKEWSIPVNAVSEEGAQELLWTFAQLGLGL